MKDKKEEQIKGKAGEIVKFLNEQQLIAMMMANVLVFFLCKNKSCQTRQGSPIGNTDLLNVANHANQVCVNFNITHSVFF